MKKRIFIAVFLLIAAIVSVFGGCGSQPAVEAGAVDDPLLEEYVEEYTSEINRYDTPEGLFRSENSYIMMSDAFVARILYPVTGNDGMDKEIEDYVQKLAAEHSKDAKKSGKDGDEPAELTMEYEAVVIDGKYAGIKLSGVYEAPFMAHPYDIIKTFNGSVTEEKILKITDVIKEEKLDLLCRMIEEKTDIYEEYTPDELLEGWRLTEEGIEVTLERGKFTPMSSGSPVIAYTFDELKGMMIMDFEPEPEEMAPAEEQDDIPVIIPADREIDPDKPMIAITFDDGPGAYTDRLLDIFEKHGGRGTFFLVGNQVKKRTETVQRMVADGHEVAGHSWNHRQLTKLTGEELEEQFMKPRAAVYKATGVDPVIMRPPYGSYNDSVSKVAKDLGISAINWNVDTLDWKNKNADAVYRECMKGLKDGNIILCHDIHKTTVDAMEKVIPAIIAEGYQLVTVTELLTAEGKELEAGKLYFKG